MYVMTVSILLTLILGTFLLGLLVSAMHGLLLYRESKASRSSFSETRYEIARSARENREGQKRIEKLQYETQRKTADSQIRLELFVAHSANERFEAEKRLESYLLDAAQSRREARERFEEYQRESKKRQQEFGQYLKDMLVQNRMMIERLDHVQPEDKQTGNDKGNSNAPKKDNDKDPKNDPESDNGNDSGR